MRLFTQQLYDQMQIEDESKFQDQSDEWERRLKIYEEQLKELEKGGAYFLKEMTDLCILLHDAQILAIHQCNQETLKLLVYKCIPPRDVGEITYYGAHWIIVEHPNEKGEVPKVPHKEYLYDEFGQEGTPKHRDHIWTHNILFSDRTELEVKFREIHFRLNTPVWPAARKS